MGAWGPGIFSDDLAVDIRGEYRAMLEDQVPDAQATQRIVEAYRDLDADEEHVLWLALAAVQSPLGRLEEHVRARAVEVIDRGQGLERWEEAGTKDLAKRTAALAKLRDSLTGDQPARRTVRRPWRHQTDLQPGDVLATTTEGGAVALLRVLWIDDDRVGAAPVVGWLAWDGGPVPPPEEIAGLPVRPDPEALRSGGQPATYRVARLRKKDPDWGDAGFVVATHLPPRAEDAHAEYWTLTTWEQLHQDLDRLTATSGTS